MSRHPELVASLREAGHRWTPQRESVLAALAESARHLTAEEIIARVRVRYPYLNKSAVYRNLAFLTRLGLVHQTDLGHGHIEYELHQDPHHHHLICRHCHHVLQIDHAALATLGKKLERDFGFQADLDHFAIFGVCKKCQTRAAKTAKRAAR
ncbi:MAG: Zinc-specific metallo-regulatory protein [Anaerolineae bacterium]|nr:Zinc-specific metallo-regulatory protein [Anaerolineae bacterium]